MHYRRSRLAGLPLHSSEYDRIRAQSLLEFADREGLAVGRAYRAAKYWKAYKTYGVVASGLATTAYKKVKGYLSAKKLAPHLETTVIPGPNLFTPPSYGLRGTKRAREGDAAPSTISSLRSAITAMSALTSSGKDQYVTYKSRKVKESGSLKRNYRYRRQKGLTVTDLLQAMCPIVKWNMTANAVRYDSESGKQNFYAGGADNAMLQRPQLKDIYIKLQQDGGIAPQTSIVYGPQHYIKSTVLSETHDPYLPSLQCLEYKRVYEFSNRGDNLAYVEIWECVARDHTDTNFIAQWEAQLIRSTTTVDGVYGLQALNSNTRVPKVEKTYSVTDPGLEPFSNLKNLHDNYQIMRKARYRIEPGAHGTHTVYVPGFTVSHTALFDPEREDKWIKDLSLNIVYKLIGERCYDNDNTAAGTNHLSYMPTEVVFSYKDYTKWRIRPRIRKTFSFTTNSIEDFSYQVDGTDVYKSENDVPIASKPVTAMPHSAQCVENTPEPIDRDGKVAAGNEMEIVDNGAPKGDLT